MNGTQVSETTQYLTFHLQDEVFALDISKVREVLDYTKITKVPRSPDYLRGVINLRGSVVPVVDLRLKLGMAAAGAGDSCIIITEVVLDDGAVILGTLADSVQEVMDLDPDRMEPPPKIGTKLRTEFIKGMGEHGDRFIIVLDIDKVFNADNGASGPDERADMTMAGLSAAAVTA